MSQIADLQLRARLSDPLPTRCAACFCAPTEDVRFVDFDAAVDRGAVVEEGSMAVVDSIDELHLCEACVKQGAEVLEFVPGLHRQHLARIRADAVVIEEQAAYIKTLERALSARPVAA